MTEQKDNKEQQEPEEELVYVTHTCKRCERAFMDIDYEHVTDLPSRARYCPDCVKLGFKNRRRVKRSPEYIEAFKARMKKAREQRKEHK